MKTAQHTSRLTALAALLGSFLVPTVLSAIPSVPPAPQVNAGEIFAQGNFTGQHAGEMIVVDRTAGTYRAALDDGSGNLVWHPARHTGLATVDEVAVGRFTTTDRQQIVLINRESNQIVLIQPSLSAAEAEPVIQTLPFPELYRLSPGFFTGSYEDPENVLSQLALWTSAMPPQDGDISLIHFLNFDERNDRPWQSLATEESAPFSGQVFGTVPFNHTNRPMGDLLLWGESDGGGDSLLGISLHQGGLLNHFDEANPFSEASRMAVARLGFDEEPSVILYTPGAPLISHLHIEDVSQLFHPISQPPSIDFNVVGTCNLLQNIRSVTALSDQEGSAGHGRFLFIYSNGTADVRIIGDSCPSDPLEVFFFPDRESYNAGFSQPNGDLILLAGPTPAESTEYHRYDWDGRDYTFVETGSLPDTEAPAPTRPNILGFSGHPFLSEDSVLTAIFRVNDWTAEANLQDSEVFAESYTFSGESGGLISLGSSLVGDVGRDVTDVLGNQVLPTVSIMLLEPVDEISRYTVSLLPAGGSFTRPVSLQFSTDLPDGLIYFQRGEDQPWELYSADSPPLLALTSTVRYFAAVPGSMQAATPIRSTEFNFTPEALLVDSNKDGVPDFIREAFGLDPFGPADSSGNGVSDFEEIARGYDPADPNDSPGSSLWDRSRLFELWVYPAHPVPGQPFGTIYRTVEGTPLTLAQLGEPTTQNSQVGTAPSFGGMVPGALFEGPSPAEPALMTLTTPPLVELTPESLETGQEMVGVDFFPRIVLPQVDYNPSGLSLEEEIALWQDAVLAAYSDFSPEPQESFLHEISTFHAALLEFALEIRATLWNEEWVGPITLFPHRAGDGDRLAITEEILRTLAGPSPDLRVGMNAPDLWQEIEAAINPHFGTITDLARAIYVARFENQEDPELDLPRPLDVFRYFLREEGDLPGSYGDLIEAPEGSLETLYVDLIDILLVDLYPDTFLSVRNVLVTADTFSSGACRPVYDPDEDSTIHLLNSQGEPWTFPGGGTLPAGTNLILTGEEVGSGSCPGAGFIVRSSELVFLPTVAGEDSSGNLLPDQWELTFFGQTGLDPFDDASGNGYSNLQHYLDGFDPRLNSPIPNRDPVDLGPPALAVTRHSSGGLFLHWNYPADYGSQLAFLVETSTDLANWEPLPTNPGVLDGDDSFVLDLEQDPDEREETTTFYRLRMALP